LVFYPLNTFVGKTKLKVVLVQAMMAHKLRRYSSTNS